LGGMITSDSRRTYETKSRILMPKAAFNKKRNFVTRKLDLNLSKKREKCYN
jgi:hypothetical protein